MTARQVPVRRRFPLAALALSSVACGGPPPVAIPAVDAALTLRAARTEVASGEPLRLEVERVWRKDLVPDELDVRTLSPLAVRAVSRARREDAHRVAETRVFQAFAFVAAGSDDPAATAPSAGALEVVVRPRPFVARSRDGAREVRAPVTPLRLLVSPSPPAATSGPPEPPELPAEARSVLGPAMLVGALLAAAALVASRRRRRPSLPAPLPPPAAPGDDGAGVALAALDALDAQPADATSAPRVAELLRTYLRQRFGLAADRRTTPELLDAVRAAAPSTEGAAAALRQALHTADLAKFSGAPIGAADDTGMRASARAFVVATRRVPSPDGGAA